jgi:hypothetical protein
VGSLRVPARHTLLVTLAGALVLATAVGDLWKTRARPKVGALDRAWWLWFAPYREGAHRDGLAGRAVVRTARSTLEPESVAIGV